MLIKDITYYLQGKLTEEEALKPWDRLVRDDGAWKLFEFCLFVRDMLKKKKPA